MKELNIKNEEDLKCLKCDLLLEPGKVNIRYMKSAFAVELLKCTKCGQVYIPEELALGKILEVEKTLEDK